MNTINNMQFKWKLLLALLAPTGGLVYYATLSSPAVALIAIAVGSVVAVGVTRSSGVAGIGAGAAHNSRIRQALDNVSANVMVADTNLDIIYMNDTVSEMFRNAESDIRKDLPGFDVRTLIGTNIDSFHKAPSHQRRLLADLSGTFESQLSVGGRSFRFIANPIVAEDGERIGTVVEWADQTEQLEREEEDRLQAEKERQAAVENGRVRQALDGVSGNVMVADADLNIVYMNDTVTALFRDAEADIRKDLPNFDASKLMGTCIDMFHKNPAHQRSLLAGLNKTHTAELKVGGRTLKVVANPVVGDDGERLGTVVEWTDRTQELVVENEIQSIVDGVVSGDLTRRIALAGKSGFFEKLGRGINDLVDKVSDVVGNAKSAANSVGHSAQEISDGNVNLSQRTEEQAASLEETASSMEQMTSTVQQSADNAQQANQLAVAARDMAQKGSEVVDGAVTAMNGINESSSKIAEITTVINEIAFQTNLLALNASVEAARAGDQGRGFAVVATEVRNLAGRSATAAKEIKDLIEDSVQRVEGGTRLVNESGEVLQEIVTSVKKVTDVVGEISAASIEQSTGIAQVNKAVVEMDEMTQQNAALVEQAAAASESMSEQANELLEMMASYDIGDAAAEAEQVRATTGNGKNRNEERRSAGRPWTGRGANSADTGNGAAAMAQPASNGTDDGAWTEF